MGRVLPANALQMHVLVTNRQIINAALGRRQPSGHLAGLSHALHQALHKGAILQARQPVCADVGVSLRADPRAMKIGRYPSFILPITPLQQDDQCTKFLVIRKW